MEAMKAGCKSPMAADDNRRGVSLTEKQFAGLMAEEAVGVAPV